VATDEHGCYTLAGYSWNEEKSMCTRSWSDKLEDASEKVVVETEEDKNSVHRKEYN